MFEIQNPVYNKGRWYQTVIKSDGSAVSVYKSDIEVKLSGGTVIYPDKFHVIDAYADYDVTVGNSGKLNPFITVNKKGQQCVAIASIASFTEAAITVFGYQE